MKLDLLPTELLEFIIDETLPEGFESIATTCKRIYAVCLRFIPTHKALRAKYENFDYEAWRREPVGHRRPNAETGAWDMIVSIAIEPRIGRYIKHADFSQDSRFDNLTSATKYSDKTKLGPALALLARSPYLRKAGLDWKGYVEKMTIQTDNYGRRPYCQYSAVFLLSLLPNLKTLAVPGRWHLCNDTGRLLYAILQGSREHGDGASLARVNTLGDPYGGRYAGSQWGGNSRGFYYRMHDAIPFFALPSLQRFAGKDCASCGDDEIEAVSTVNTAGIAALVDLTSALEHLSFEHSGISNNDFAITLASMPRLRTLRYTYCTNLRPSRTIWSLERLLSVIAEESGAHLEMLSICNDSTGGRGLPFGMPLRIPMQKFRILHSLELEIDIFVSCIKALRLDADDSAMSTSATPRGSVSMLAKVLPVSVRRLSLVINGWAQYKLERSCSAIDHVSRDLKVNGTRQVPNLTHIYLVGTHDQDFHKSYEKLRIEAKKVGIETQTRFYDYYHSMFRLAVDNIAITS